jgi:hypothetical protein
MVPPTLFLLRPRWLTASALLGWSELFALAATRPLDHPAFKTARDVLAKGVTAFTNGRLNAVKVNHSRLLF